MLEVQPKAKGVDGSPEYILVQSENAASGGYGPAVGQFDGTEVLLCEVWPGSDRAVVATLPVAWFNAQTGETNPPADWTRLKIEFPAASLADLEIGRYLVDVTADDKDKHLARFAFDLVSGPGTAVARPVYHTYKQLKDECPWVDRFADHLNDETGFADAAADARDWIDDCIIKAVPDDSGEGLSSNEWGWTWGSDLYSPSRYAEALADGGMALTTAGGSQVVKASVYKTLATLCRRAVGMTNAPADLITLGAKYEAMANAAIISARVEFPGSTLRPIDLGRTNVRRIPRSRWGVR